MCLHYEQTLIIDQFRFSVLPAISRAGAFIFLYEICYTVNEARMGTVYSELTLVDTGAYTIMIDDETMKKLGPGISGEQKV